MTSTTPLNPSSVTTLILAALPKEGQTLLKTPTELVGLVVHACLRSAGFKLLTIGEAPDELHVYADDMPLPQGWTPHFRYSHDQSAMKFVTHVSRLGGMLAVQALAEGDDKRCSFDVKITDVLKNSEVNVSFAEGTTDDDRKNIIMGLFQDLRSFERLIDMVKTNIIRSIAPGIIEKGGLDATPSRATQQQQPSHPRDPQPAAPQAPTNPYGIPTPNQPNPAHRPPPGEVPPGFEDPLDIYRDRGRGQAQGNPFSIGHDDLYPQGLGPNDPFRPSLGPGGLRMPGTGGGMHPDFNHPMFGGRGGGMGDPQVPPGARYDPMNPDDPRGGPPGWPGAGHQGPFGGGGFGPGGFGGGGGNPFGGGGGII